MRIVELPDGRQAVVKQDPSARAEAAGLRWLRASGDLPVPKVYGVDDRTLRTQYVPPSAPDEAAAQVFGRGLAQLHLRGAPAHGCPPPGGPADAWIGHAPMHCEPYQDWASFYVELRVLPYLRASHDAGTLSPAEAARIERACEVLPSVCGPPEPPARLHGDLWSGNVHWAADGGRPGGGSAVWLIDPAAHGGHRETDLAMLRLFGLPHLDVVLDAYAGAAADLGAPLAEGWPARTGLHQLFPLLVHAQLFGRGYAAQAVAAARSVLALG